MRFTAVPGAAELGAALGEVRDGVADALTLVSRAEDEVGRLADLLAPATQVLCRVERLVSRVERLVSRADDELTAAEGTRQKVDVVTSLGAELAAHADEVLTGAEGLEVRAAPLVAAYERPLAGLAPAVDRLAQKLDPAQVDNVVTAVDRLDELLPILESLRSVAPDLHRLLGAAEELHRMAEGLPGARLLRRRGEIVEEESPGQQRAGTPFPA